MNRVKTFLRPLLLAVWPLVLLVCVHAETAPAQEPDCTVVAGLLYCDGRPIVIPPPATNPAPVPIPPPPASPTANRPPVIVTIPLQTFTADQSGQYAVQASDPDGDRVRFSLTNSTHWLSIDTLTGIITATPTAADVGRYHNIMVRGADGKSGIASSSFSVDVVTMARGSVSLSWIAPTAREDGSALTNLAGFRIYTGRSPSDLRQARWLTNPGLSRFLLENLTPGRWYFALSALDANGLESEFSEVVSRDVL